MRAYFDQQKAFIFMFSMGFEGGVIKLQNKKKTKKKKRGGFGWVAQLSFLHATPPGRGRE